MRKVDDGEEKEKRKKKKEKRMTFIVATNVVASWPPKCRPTGTPHARTNYLRVFHENTSDSISYPKIEEFKVRETENTKLK